MGITTEPTSATPLRHLGSLVAMMPDAHHVLPWDSIPRHRPAREEISNPLPLYCQRATEALVVAEEGVERWRGLRWQRVQ
jgi:hypothetical protein